MDINAVLSIVFGLLVYWYGYWIYRSLSRMEAAVDRLAKKIDEHLLDGHSINPRP